MRNKRYSLDDAMSLEVDDVHCLYSQHVNPQQVNMISSFPFGRELVKLFRTRHQSAPFGTPGEKIGPDNLLFLGLLFLNHNFWVSFEANFWPSGVRSK